MRTILILCLLLSLTIVSNAYQKESLEQKIDTSQINAKLRILEGRLNSNPDSSIIVLESIVAQTKNSFYSSIYLEALNLISIAESVKGNDKIALKYSLLALQKARSIGDTLKMTKLYNNIGYDYLMVSNMQMAYDYFRKSKVLAEKVGDRRIEAISMHNIGSVLKFLGQYEEAIKVLLQAGKMSEEIDDHQGKAYMYQELGETYLLMQDYSKAIKYFKLGINESSKYDINDILGDMYLGLGDAYYYVNDHENSLKNSVKAMNLGEDLDNTDLMVRSLNGFARYSINNSDFDEAKIILDKALKLCETLDNRSLIAETLKLKSINQEKRGLYKEALNSFKKAKYIEDSLNNSMRMIQIEQLRLEAELERKNFEISVLNTREIERKADIEKQRILSNVLAAILAMVVFLLYTAFRSSQKYKRLNGELVKRKKEIAQKTNDLKKLNKVKDKFMSIIAHDLRSPLHSISGALYLIELEDNLGSEHKKLLDDLREKVDSTTDFLNNLLHWIMEQKDNVILTKTGVNVNKLVDKSARLLKNYSNKGVTIDNSVDDNFTIFADENMMDLVVRNLLINAIKFSNKQGLIEIKAETNNDFVTVHIKDQGVGISSEDIKDLFDPRKKVSKNGTMNESGSGLGLEFCKEFISKNNGNIWVESEENLGTTVSFAIPSAH